MVNDALAHIGGYRTSSCAQRELQRVTEGRGGSWCRIADSARLAAEQIAGPGERISAGSARS